MRQLDLFEGPTAPERPGLWVRVALSAYRPEADLMNSPEAVADSLAEVAIAADEHIIAIAVDNRNRETARTVLSAGTVDQAHCYPRAFVRWLLDCDASGVILAHNHPGGSMTPSPSDRALTDKLKAAAETIEVRFLDHVIVSGKIDRQTGQATATHCSFRESGLL